MSTRLGYTTSVDALNCADNVGNSQYWMNYRVVFRDVNGAYDYCLTNRQDWREMIGSAQCQVIAYRERNNAFPAGFTNWVFESQ